MSPILPMLLAAGLVTGSQGTTRPATQPASRPEPAGEPTNVEEGRQAAQEQIRLLLERHPGSEPGRLDELISARFENGFLLVELKEVPEQSPLVMPLADRDGSVAKVTPINKSRLLDESESPAVSRFRLEVHHLGGEDPEVYATTVELYAGSLPGQLNMSMVRSAVGRSLNVQLIQLVPGVEEENPVRLHIGHEDLVDEEGNSYVVIPAPSFQDLARRDPEAFDRYVRPMLAELGIAEVLDGNLREVATQLFLADLPLEPGVREQVEGLLARLDSADFMERETAQRELEALGRPAATALLALSRGRELSLEQASRVKSIVAPYQPLEPEELQQRAGDPAFLREVAALRGGAEDEALARLAAGLLREQGDAPATRPESQD